MNEQLETESNIQNSITWMSSKPSLIHGTGAFAAADIEKGSKFFVDLPRITHAGYETLKDALPPKEKEFFLTTIDHVYDIRHSALRFMNHSHTPNIDWEDGLNIIILKNIRKGEELTIDYGWETYPWDAA